MKFTGFFISLGSIGFWIAITEYWGDFTKVLNEINPVIIPAGLFSLMIVGAIVFFYEYKTRKTDSKEICQKIYGELKDGIESLDGTLDRKTIQHEINGKKINYKHIYMNHKVFDGYVNSGDFNQIHHELQQPIQDIYGKISIHDEFVKKAVDCPIDDDILILNQYEKELKKEIPPIMEKLKNYF